MSAYAVRINVWSSDGGSSDLPSRVAYHASQSAGAMPEVISPGPEGRLEGRFQPGPRPRAPVAMILHPHPQAGGTMNNAIVQALYKTFVRRGFATLRFNFREIGRASCRERVCQYV